MRCKVCDDPACKREQADSDVTAAVDRYMEASQSPLFVEACELNPLDKKPEHVAEFDRVTGLRREWEKALDVMTRANADCASRPAVDWRQRALDAEAKLERLADEGRELAIKARDDRKALRDERRWVSVEERLPNSHVNVLILINGRVQIAHYEKRDGKPGSHPSGWFGPSLGFGKVTHWMPLPAAPETP